MALEDGWVLAQCLRRSGSVSAALRDYERQRRPRTRWIASQSELLGEIIQLEHPLLTSLRDTAMRLTPDRLAALALAPVFDFRV
jgi:2-polyprenyl-6-methoxyphenol hydroxylase-like FAD-dependent oxidoreductase